MMPALDLTVRMRRPLVLPPRPPRKPPPMLGRPRPSRLDRPRALRAWVRALPWRFFLIAFALSASGSYTLERYCTCRQMCAR